jgi:pseudouridine-5'-phosphate glycosidase
VHRQAETTFDVSADLPEFQTSNVAVVSAGAKAILDLPKTLETLETLGVPVIGYGTNEFPAFYYPSSGEKVPMRLDTPNEVAAFLNAKWSMGLRGGALIANPIPQAFALDAELIESAILTAIQQADALGIKGKETTPFLLKKLNEITVGESQIANKALVLNNAKVAAQIAVALHHTGK